MINKKYIKLKCVDNKYISGQCYSAFIIGEIYCGFLHSSGEYYLIVNRGLLLSCPTYMFKTLSKIRNEKIDKLLNNYKKF
jgi:hypothetical protein